MSAVEVDLVDEPQSASDREWAAIAVRAPQLAVTGRRYLAQIGVSLQRRSVEAADNTLRLFVAFITDEHPDVHAFADVRRIHIEDFKTWLRQRRAPRGGTLSANTIRQRLGTLRAARVGPPPRASRRTRRPASAAPARCSPSLSCSSVDRGRRRAAARGPARIAPRGRSAELSRG